MRNLISAQDLIDEGISDFFDLYNPDKLLLSVTWSNEEKGNYSFYKFNGRARSIFVELPHRRDSCYWTRNGSFAWQPHEVSEALRFEKFLHAHKIAPVSAANAAMRYLLRQNIRVRKYIRELKFLYGEINKQVSGTVHYNSFIKKWALFPGVVLENRTAVVDWGLDYDIRRKLRMSSREIHPLAIREIRMAEQRGIVSSKHYLRGFKAWNSSHFVPFLTIFNKCHDQINLAKTSILFGNKLIDWIKKMRKERITWQDMDYQYDWVLPRLKEDQIQWAFKTNFDKKFTIRILLYWDTLLEQNWDPNEKNSREKASKIIRSIQYYGVLNKEVAELSGVLGFTQRQFLFFQEYWMSRIIVDHQTVPAPGGITGIVMDGIRLYQLDKDDLRAPVIGAIVLCCQHLDGLGASCARHSVESPDGAVWVVERHGSILAQSWVWRAGNSEILVIDNIEADALDDNLREKVKRLYLLAIKSIEGRLGISQVFIGKGYTKIDFDDCCKIKIKKIKPNSILPANYIGYTDTDTGMWRII